MNNPETQAILSTQDTERRPTKQKTHNTVSEKDEKHGLHQKFTMICLALFLILNIII